jgi:hypothetical protein
MKLVPKIRNIFASLISFSESPTAYCHPLPNNKGLYHTEPIAKDANAATITAKRLTFVMSIINNLICYYYFKPIGLD